MSPPGRRAWSLLLLLLVLACGSEPEPRAGDAAGQGADVSRDTVVDAEARRVLLSAPPERIVSLVPSATETLLALGARDRLVGRTDYDSVRAVRDLPSVGGGLQPSLEMLLSLRPDLVIRFAGESDRSTPARLDEAGVPHLAVRPERIEDVEAMIRTLGRVVDRAGAADSIVAAQRIVLDSIRSRVAGTEPVRVAFTLGGEPPWVAGPETFVGQLVELAGGINVFSDLDRPWAGVSAEVFLDRNPHLVVMVGGSDMDSRLVRGRDVRRVAPFVQLPGPALGRAALEIARALRPELFDGGAAGDGAGGAGSDGEGPGGGAGGAAP